MENRIVLKQLKRNILAFIRNFGEHVEIKSPTFLSKQYKNHIYQNVGFENNEQLAAYLKKNIVYNQNGLIAINKPYGLKRYIINERRPHHTKLEINMTPCAYSMNDFSLEGILPYLAKELDVKELHIAKVPERYNTGITLLSTTAKGKERIAKRISTWQEPLLTFVGLCIGIPTEFENECKLGMTITGNKASSAIDSHNKRVSIVDKWSHQSVRKGKVYPVVFQHRVVSCNKELSVSLVEVTVDSTKWHSVRMYYATRLFAPLLGDNIYGSRVGYINGVPLALNPFSPVASLPQRLSKDVLDKLLLRKGSEVIIPLHLHLMHIALPKTFGVDCVDIIAPLPNYFSWSCQMLDVDTSLLNINNSNDDCNDNELPTNNSQQLSVNC